jgi:hypothetical protein
MGRNVLTRLNLPEIRDHQGLVARNSAMPAFLEASIRCSSQHFKESWNVG